MEQFLAQNQWVVWLVILWTLPWKGVALWKAALRSHKCWFIVLLVVNSLAILEILYIFVFSKRKISKESKKSFSAGEAKRVGESLRIDWSKFDLEQFRKGMDIELEHGLRDFHTNVTNDNPLMTGKIALAHLNEFSDYYLRLEKMEKEAEGFH